MLANAKRVDISILLVMVTLCFGGCNVVDNQTTMNAEDRAVVDPAPVKRPFVDNNKNHKVLLGVIDGGVDYNHPMLANNMHFILDNAGTPTECGYDYVGADKWASPYLARTALYDSNVAADAKLKAVEARDKVKDVLALEPELSRFLNLSRHVTQENSGAAYHGTHVAGLMVYDRPDFGLLAYRVLPQGLNPSTSYDYTKEAVDNINGSMDKASKDGARVVNMSLGLEAKKAIAGEESDDTVAKVRKFTELAKTMADTMRRNPRVLFVAAAGNESQWRDGENLMGMPCGLKVDNLLCVGALRENGDPATFTNVTISGVDVVFALGHKVLSTMPNDMCVKEELSKLDTSSMAFPSLSSGGTDNESIAKALKKACFQTPGFGKLSGTSMASPLVARIAAEVIAANPSLMPKQVIKEIYKLAKPSFVGNVPVYKLKIKKPSWYAAVEEQMRKDAKDSAVDVKTGTSGGAKSFGRMFDMPDVDVSGVLSAEPVRHAIAGDDYWEAIIPNGGSVK